MRREMRGGKIPMPSAEPTKPKVLDDEEKASTELIAVTLRHLGVRVRFRVRVKFTPNLT